MTETEFEILDELYFVTSFKELQSKLNFSENILKSELGQMAGNGFVKCLFPNPDSEIEFAEKAFEENYINYYFLATKKGLLLHNSR